MYVITVLTFHGPFRFLNLLFEWLQPGSYIIMAVHVGGENPETREDVDDQHKNDDEEDEALQASSHLHGANRFLGSLHELKHSKKLHEATKSNDSHEPGQGLHLAILC
jgi:hypothetical protein